VGGTSGAETMLTLRNSPSINPRLDPSQRKVSALRSCLEMPVPANTVSRTEELLDTGLEFRPGDPIHVRVVHRDQRTHVTDDGAAINRTGSPTHWQDVAHRLGRELDVNISRRGVISLPVVRVGPPRAEVVHRIAGASRAFYQELLELDG